MVWKASLCAEISQTPDFRARRQQCLLGSFCAGTSYTGLDTLGHTCRQHPHLSLPQAAGLCLSRALGGRTHQLHRLPLEMPGQVLKVGLELT